MKYSIGWNEKFPPTVVLSKPNFVNLTPHSISICSEGGEIMLTIPPSGEVLRISTISRNVGEIVVKKQIDEVTSDIIVIPIVQNQYSADVDVDVKYPKETGKFYIVSLLVKQYFKHRDDFLVPDTTPASAVRDENGRIKCVRRFMI